MQEILCSAHDSMLLDTTNAFQGATKAGTLSRAYLNKHENLAIAHHEINFSRAELNIACDQLQSGLFQHGEGLLLGSGSASLRGRHSFRLTCAHRGLRSCTAVLSATKALALHLTSKFKCD